MKTLSIVVVSLLFVSLRLFAGEAVVGQKNAPLCTSHNQGDRKAKEVKDEDKKSTEQVKTEGIQR